MNNRWKIAINYNKFKTTDDIAQFSHYVIEEAHLFKVVQISVQQLYPVIEYDLKVSDILPFANEPLFGTEIKTVSKPLRKGDKSFYLYANLPYLRPLRTRTSIQSKFFAT